jgi:hypothetical protein
MSFVNTFQIHICKHFQASNPMVHCSQNSIKRTAFLLRLVFFLIFLHGARIVESLLVLRISGGGRAHMSESRSLSPVPSPSVNESVHEFEFPSEPSEFCKESSELISECADCLEHVAPEYDPFKPGGAFLKELLDGPPLLEGELAKMVRYDHKNDQRLEYLTRTYNFVLRWKKDHEHEEPRNISASEFRTRIMQMQERLKSDGFAGQKALVTENQGSRPVRLTAFQASPAMTRQISKIAGALMTLNEDDSEVVMNPGTKAGRARRK